MTSLDASGSETNIVVLDACRNNPLPASSGRAATRGLAVIGTKPRNSVIIYAAESGNVAQDGLFTPALIRALSIPLLSLGEMVMQVRREVYELSKGAQTPGEYNQLFAPVYLAGIKETGATPPSPIAVVPAALSVGDTYAGGIVFYLDGKGYGLVAASKDQSTGADWAAAKKLCDELVLNGYSDWRLPTKDELNLMYLNLKKAGRGSFASAWYWSSSEDSIDYAWGQDFGGGVQHGNLKGSRSCVQAVRAFNY
jgi:hypothetical protein